jgi:hypothetical protein
VQKEGGITAASVLSNDQSGAEEVAAGRGKSRRKRAKCESYWDRVGQPVSVVTGEEFITRPGERRDNRNTTNS